jgi:hypothetical protein
MESAPAMAVMPMENPPQNVKKPTSLTKKWKSRMMTILRRRVSPYVRRLMSSKSLVLHNLSFKSGKFNHHTSTNIYTHTVSAVHKPA